MSTDDVIDHRNAKSKHRAIGLGPNIIIGQGAVIILTAQLREFNDNWRDPKFRAEIMRRLKQ